MLLTRYFFKPKQILTQEGTAELRAPPTEGEYFVGIMINGVGYVGTQ